MPLFLILRLMVITIAAASNMPARGKMKSAVTPDVSSSVTMYGSELSPTVCLPGMLVGISVGGATAVCVGSEVCVSVRGTDSAVSAITCVSGEAGVDSITAVVGEAVAEGTAVAVGVTVQIGRGVGFQRVPSAGVWPLIAGAGTIGTPPIYP